MNDDFLYKFRKPPRPEFAASLYQRITNGTGGSAPLKTTSRFYTLRFLTLALSLIAILAGVLFFSAPARALADRIIRQFGGVTFVQATPQPEPTQPGKNLAGPKETISPAEQAAVQQTKTAARAQTTSQPKAGQKTDEQGATHPALDAQAVSQLVGFTVLAPAYLPEGYTASSGGWQVSQENDSSNATLSQINGKIGLEGVSGGAFNNYVNQAAGGIITIEELKVPQGQSKTIDSPNIEDVTVRGLSGAWMPGVGQWSILAWEESGITYLVVGNSLSQDEALKVAGSLGK
jgi:hypothetical protein